MEAAGKLLENDFVLITSIVAISSLLLISMTKRHEIQKAQNRSILEENKAKLKQKELELQLRQAALLNAKSKLTGVQLSKKELKIQAQLALLDQDKTNDAQAQLAAQLAEVPLAEQEAYINKELALTNAEVYGTKLDILNTDMQIAQNAAGIGEIWGNMASIMTPVISILSIINTLQQAYAAAQLKSAAAAKVQTAAEGEKATTQATGMFAGIVSAFSSAGIPGVIAGIAIASALVAALGVGIAVAIAAAGGFSNKTGAERTADAINQLSKEIYDLNKKSAAIDTVLNKFDDLDNKILKTNADLKEMSDLLASAADSLSDEEKEVYNSLTTDQARREYLASLKATTDADLASKRAEQRQDILNLRNRGGAQWSD